VKLLLRKIFSKFDNDRVNLQIANGKHGHTTALEFVGEFGSKVNIMLNDVGDIANFGPERIDHEDGKQILKNADAVMVVNGGSNLRGSELVEFAFEQSPNSYHCIDPADIDARRFEFKDTLTKISNMTSSLNINENECNSLLNTLDLDSHKISELKFQNSDSENIVKKAALEIANKLNVKLNIHTRIGAAWSDGKETLFAPSFKVEPQTLTGAGDSWDSECYCIHGKTKQRAAIDIL
jgi:ribokinase